MKAVQESLLGLLHGNSSKEAIFFVNPSFPLSEAEVNGAPSNQNGIVLIDLPPSLHDKTGVVFRRQEVLGEGTRSGIDQFESSVRVSVERDRAIDLVHVSSEIEVDVLRECASSAIEPSSLLEVLERTHEIQWTGTKKDIGIRSISAILALPMTRTFFKVDIIQIDSFGRGKHGPETVELTVSVVDPRGSREQINNTTTVFHQDRRISFRDYPWDYGQPSDQPSRRLSNLMLHFCAEAGAYLYF